MSHEPKQRRLDNFAVSTTLSEKDELDLAVGKFFYSSNISFNSAESKQFKNMIQKLRPGYSPPNRHKLSGELLDKVYSNLTSNARSILNGQRVTLSLDGWSNIANQSLIVSSLQCQDKVYVVDCFDASSESHTGDYLANIAKKQIDIAEEKFGVDVVAIVTDNASNMVKMRQIIGDKRKVINYGCSAHQANLLAKDVTCKDTITNVTQVAKCFSKSHLASAWLIEQGAKKPPLPSNVRWSSTVSTLQWYLNEWQKLKQIADSHGVFFQTEGRREIVSFLRDMSLYNSVEQQLKWLRPIANALDVFQSDKCSVAEAVEVWKELLNQFRESNAEETVVLQCAIKRYNLAVHTSWVVANILHPKYIGKNLTTDEWKSAKEWVKSEFPDALPHFINFIGGDKDRMNSEFMEAKSSRVSHFLNSEILMGNLCETLGNLAHLLLVLVPSSAGVERVFSSMGFIHSESRNRLGHEKVSKLAFCMRLLNSESD